MNENSKFCLNTNMISEVCILNINNAFLLDILL